jgi:3'(2'), 5'-bisphosphate nucleotidase
MNDHELARTLAEQAGQLLLDIRGEIDLVAPGTTADHDVVALGDLGDRVANEFLIEQLSLHRPDDVILSEESIDPATRHNANRVWIIDPLDGTASYSRGYPGFAVHVALWEAGATEPGNIAAAAVSVPVDKTTLSTADRVHYMPEFDSGVTGNLHSQAVGWALSARDDIRIVTSPSNPPDELDFVIAGLKQDFQKSISVERRGSVGAKMAYIIAGNADIYLNTWGFSEWDIAAPLAVARHYGIAALLPDGTDFTFNNSDVSVPGALICRRKYVPSILRSLAL